MSEKLTYKLKATTREITGKKVKKLRKDGFIPAVLYGHGTKPTSLSLKTNEFSKIYEEAGTSSLVDLKIDENNSVKVLTHEPQRDPVRNLPIHVDFYKVRMDEKIKTEIPLEFIGVSDAVETLDGSFVTNRDSIEIECLPTDLVSEVTIDLSVLKTFEDQVTVKDLKLPSTIEVLTDLEEVICFVEEPRSEEELAELEETSAAEQEAEAIEQMTAEGEGEKAEGEEEAEPKAKEE